MKTYISMILLAVSLAACGPPKPPCCEDVGLGLHPINPEMMSQEQTKAVQAQDSNKGD